MRRLNEVEDILWIDSRPHAHPDGRDAKMWHMKVKLRGVKWPIHSCLLVADEDEEHEGGPAGICHQLLASAQSYDEAEDRRQTLGRGEPWPPKGIEESAA